jgi:DNA-binding MarR family transcriptional regulator
MTETSTTATPTADSAEACSGSDVQAFRTFMSAHALIVGAIDTALAAAELPPLVWHDVLAVVDTAPDGRMRPHELADRLVISRSGLSRVLDRMEAEQVLRRERCSSDRRGTYAVITDTGRELLARMTPVYRSMVELHFLPHLGGEAESVHEALERVADSAREACPADAA